MFSLSTSICATLKACTLTTEYHHLLAFVEISAFPSCSSCLRRETCFEITEYSICSSGNNFHLQQQRELKIDQLANRIPREFYSNVRIRTLELFLASSLHQQKTNFFKPIRVYRGLLTTCPLHKNLIKNTTKIISIP
jgi:hypothetical protein